MNKFFASLVAFVALALAIPAAADDCWTTSDPEVAAGGFYVDNDNCQPECLFSIWVYQESNEIEGLQRGDEFHSDITGCDGVDSDTIIV